MERKKLPGISKDAFVCDGDRVALESLKKLPILPKLIQKFHELGLDRWRYCQNMAYSVRCGPNQYATLHRILTECCEILDMPEPELYVSSHPMPNAFAGGVERPYITLRSSIIDTMTDEELYHLIGHELGHIKAGHVLYFSVFQVAWALLEMISARTIIVGDAVSIGVVMAFYEWSRQAEVTADRAGLLCSQEFNLSAHANLSLCAGPNRLSHEQSIDAFMEQSRAYQDMSLSDSVGKVLLYLFNGFGGTHPMPVHRTKELEKWVQNGTYDQIMKGHYVREKLG